MEKEAAPVLPADLVAALNVMESFSSTANELIAARKYIELLFVKHLPTAPHIKRTRMSCGHYADTITHDTLASFCSECHNVETWTEEHFICEECGADCGEYARDGGEPDCPRCMAEAHRQRDLNSDLCEDR